MRLTDQQIAEFDNLGYLIMPDYFSKVEVAVLRSEAAKIYADDRKEVWRESSGAPRTAFAAHATFTANANAASDGTSRTSRAAGVGQGARGR